MGHIDHGKSTLLDYIRKSNITEGEAGGITQHIAAYEVTHEDETGQQKRITFLDTPGHEAFKTLRSRGANVADIAILVVAADDGVQAQTKEALAAIETAGIPYIVAINKIDKNNADVNATIQSLIEEEVYLEGYGGDIPYAEISAKSGTNVDELLDLILLVAELQELTMSPDSPGHGVVIETETEPRMGISGTLIIQNGAVRQSQYVHAGGSIAPVRIMEDFTGTKIKEAVASSPIRILGFDTQPPVGAAFRVHETKNQAQEAAEKWKGEQQTRQNTPRVPQDTFVVPVVIKADTTGSIEAVKHEIEKLQSDRVHIAVIHTGVGNITEGDVRRAASDENGLLIGFNTAVDRNAIEVARHTDVPVETFSIIYDLIEWTSKEVARRIPKITVEEVQASAKILEVFSKRRDRQVIGGKVVSGKLAVGKLFKLLRRDEELGVGTILELQKNRAPTDTVEEGSEFGAKVECGTEIARGDVLQMFIEVEK